MKDQTIEFNAGNRRYSWRFKHNLDEYGLSIEGAFNSFLPRAKNCLDIKEFMKYATSKDPMLKMDLISKSSIKLFTK